MRNHTILTPLAEQREAGNSSGGSFHEANRVLKGACQEEVHGTSVYITFSRELFGALDEVFLLEAPQHHQQRAGCGPGL